MVLWNSVSGGFSYIWQSKWVGINATKTDRTQIHLLSDVLVAVASLDLKVPIALTWPGQSVYVEKRWPSLEGDSQKVDPARRVALLAKPTFRFSFKRFASFCKKMYEKLARLSPGEARRGRRVSPLPGTTFLHINRALATQAACSDNRWQYFIIEQVAPLSFHCACVLPAYDTTAR